MRRAHPGEVGALTGIRPADPTHGTCDPAFGAVRDAFQAVLRDPQFRAEIERAGFDIVPKDGEELRRLIRATLATPKNIADKARPIISP